MALKKRLFNEHEIDRKKKFLATFTFPQKISIERKVLYAPNSGKKEKKACRSKKQETIKTSTSMNQEKIPAKNTINL